jgi:cell division protein FtsQ
MSARVKKRRRPTPAARLRPYWILVVLAFTGIAFGLVALANWDALRPHGIEVTGNRIVPTDSILKIARIDPQKNLWLQNIAAMQERIESIPYVDLARVHRYLPARVVVEVNERVPVAVLMARNGDYLVDQRLRVLEDAPADAQQPQFVMPAISVGKIGDFIEDDKLVALRNDADKIADAHIDAHSFSYDRYGDLVVELRGGVRVLLGDQTDLEKKIALVDPILQQVAKAKKPIATIDLRALSAPVVIYKK